MNYAFVSGATGGIGKAFCQELAKNNTNLFITGRSADKLLALKNQINAISNIDVLTFPCDLTSEKSREEMLKFIKENSLSFSKIINVAGVDIQKEFTHYSNEKVLMQIRVNFEATICITHRLLPMLIQNGEIITISSMSGVSPMPYFALYSATKAGLTNFFTALHYELKGRAKVTTVLPAGVYTRDDIIKDIKNQGLWGKLTAKSPSFVAKISLSKAKKNKNILVYGFFNKLLYFFMKIVPKKIVLSFIKHRWSKQEKDAF